MTLSEEVEALETYLLCDDCTIEQRGCGDMVCRQYDFAVSIRALNNRLQLAEAVAEAVEAWDQPCSPKGSHRVARGEGECLIGGRSE